MKERDCKRDNNHLVNAKRAILSKYNPFIFLLAPPSGLEPETL